MELALLTLHLVTTSLLHLFPFGVVSLWDPYLQHWCCLQGFALLLSPLPVLWLRLRSFLLLHLLPGEGRLVLWPTWMSRQHASEPEAEPESLSLVLTLVLQISRSLTRGVHALATPRVIPTPELAVPEPESSLDTPPTGTTPCGRTDQGAATELVQTALAEELASFTGDQYRFCLLRIQRAWAAGQAALRKRSGSTGRVPRTPPLNEIAPGLCQPRDFKYYVVLRTADRECCVAVHRSWERCRSTVCLTGTSVPSNYSVFHSFHFRSEVRSYLPGAGLLDELPDDFESAA